MPSSTLIIMLFTNSLGGHLAKEKETPEEQVSMRFIEGLNEAHMEADKVRQRKRLAAPHFAKEEVPETHNEITDFFKNFAKRPEAVKIAQRSRFKKEQQ